MCFFFFSFLNDNLRRELSGILLAIAFKPMLLNGYATRQSSRSYPLTPFLPGLMDPRNIIRCFDVVRMFFFSFFFLFFCILKNTYVQYTGTGSRTIWINKAVTVVLFQLEGPESVDPAL